MAAHNELGTLGEKIALEHLIEQGYTILETNWVKTRKSPYLVEPETAVDLFKQRLLIFAANTYVTRFQYDLDVRFDIIGIVIYNNNEKRIEHIMDAFYPSYKNFR